MSIFLKQSDEFDVFERLVIFRLPLIIAHVIASIFLVILLTYLVYKPFKKWLKNREKHFDDKQTLISKNLNESEILKKKRIAQLSKEKILIDKISIESKKQIEIDRKKILQLAQKEQKRIIENANLFSQQKKDSLNKEIENVIIANSILLVQKILNSELDDKKHQKLIAEFINKLEKKNKDYD